MVWKKGDKVGPYRIVHQQGQGGMATVYRAYHPELDRHVAIKIMHQSFLSDKNFVSRFKREAQIVAKLEHPNIVPVYDFSSFNKQPLLVMKFIQGQTLKELLDESILSLEDILKILNPIASALDYAHRKGVLHRDIKPSNIVIDDEGTPYLTDFGLARIAQAGESSMSADMLLGTPNYMSPEQALGNKDITSATDIYSLGIVLYELLVGHVPFKADTPFAVIHDHIYTPVPPPSEINPDLPEEIENVLNRALAKDPLDRYQTATDMMNALNDAIKSSNLHDLDEGRVSLAMESMDKYRTEIVPQRVSTIRAESNRTDVVEAQKEKASLAAARRRGRIWMVTGIGIFVFFAFVGLLLLMSVWDNFLTLADAAVQTGDEFAETIEDFDLRLEPGSPIPVYIVPPIPPFLEPDMLEIEEDHGPLQYLILQHLYYKQEDNESAYEVIGTGYRDADNPVPYLFTAAKIAEENGDIFGALGFATAGAHLLLRMDDNIPREGRDAVTGYLYDLGKRVRPFDPRELTETVLDPSILGTPEFGADYMNSPVNLFVVFQSQIKRRDFLGIEMTLARLDELDLESPEFKLLLAEYMIMQSEMVEATNILENLIESDETPEWIQDQASELIEDIER